MSMHLGYLVSTGIFAAVFLAAVAVQCARRFHAVVYWTTIVATTTVGTTIADFADRSLGIGYAGGVAVLAALLLGSLVTWRRASAPCRWTRSARTRAEAFYWVTIMFSQTLGTALGDWTADSAGLGYRGTALVFGRARRGRVAPLDDAVAHDALLDGVRPHAAARRRRRRLA